MAVDELQKAADERLVVGKRDVFARWMVLTTEMHDIRIALHMPGRVYVLADAFGAVVQVYAVGIHQPLTMPKQQ